MNENRRQILEMLAAGKITADEAERLLAALDPTPATVEFSGTTRQRRRHGEDARQVSARAGRGRRDDDRHEGRHYCKRARAHAAAARRRASGQPDSAAGPRQLDEALSKHGVPITLSQIKPENLEELIDHLEDLTVDVNGTDGNTTKVRVFCE